MPKPLLQLATPDDVARIMPLFRAYQAHYRELTIASEEQTRSFLFQHLQQADRGFIVIAKIDAIIVGFAAVYITASGLLAEFIAHLGDLYVEHSYRRRSIATSLFDFVTDEAKRRRISKVRWLSLSSNTLNDCYRTLGLSSGEFQLFLRKTEANQALLPTPMAVTPRADARVAPATGAADL